MIPITKSSPPIKVGDIIEYRGEALYCIDQVAPGDFTHFTKARFVPVVEAMQTLGGQRTSYQGLGQTSLSHDQLINAGASVAYSWTPPTYTGSTPTQQQLDVLEAASIASLVGEPGTAFAGRNLSDVGIDRNPSYIRLSARVLDSYGTRVGDRTCTLYYDITLPSPNQSGATVELNTEPSKFRIGDRVLLRDFGNKNNIGWNDTIRKFVLYLQPFQLYFTIDHDAAPEDRSIDCLETREGYDETYDRFIATMLREGWNIAPGSEQVHAVPKYPHRGAEARPTREEVEVRRLVAEELMKHLQQDTASSVGTPWYSAGSGTLRVAVCGGNTDVRIRQDHALKSNLEAAATDGLDVRWYYFEDSASSSGTYPTYRVTPQQQAYMDAYRKWYEWDCKPWWLQCFGGRPEKPIWV